MKPFQIAPRSMTLTFMLKIAFSDLQCSCRRGHSISQAHLVEPVAMGTSWIYEHISSSSLDSWWMRHVKQEMQTPSRHCEAKKVSISQIIRTQNFRPTFSTFYIHCIKILVPFQELICSLDCSSFYFSIYRNKILVSNLCVPTSFSLADWYFICLMSGYIYNILWYSGVHLVQPIISTLVHNPWLSLCVYHDRHFLRFMYHQNFDLVTIGHKISLLLRRLIIKWIMYGF